MILEGSNLISGDSTGIISSSFNSADESEILHQIHSTKYKRKKRYFRDTHFSNLFSIIKVNINTDLNKKFTYTMSIQTLGILKQEAFKNKAKISCKTFFF